MQASARHPPSQAARAKTPRFCGSLPLHRRRAAPYPPGSPRARGFAKRTENPRFLRLPGKNQCPPIPECPCRARARYRSPAARTPPLWFRAQSGDDIPLLPFPDRRILPSVQIPISSVTVQNPPALLPSKSACLLPIRPSRRCRSQPLPGVSRKQRYNTLDFPRESRVPREEVSPLGFPLHFRSLECKYC